MLILPFLISACSVPTLTVHQSFTDPTIYVITYIDHRFWERTRYVTLTVACPPEVPKPETLPLDDRCTIVKPPDVDFEHGHFAIFTIVAIALTTLAISIIAVL